MSLQKQKTCECGFRLRIAFSKKLGDWVVTVVLQPLRSRAANRPHQLSGDDKEHLVALRKENGLSMSSILSLLREDGKEVTRQQVWNAIDGFLRRSTHSNANQSQELMERLCADPGAVFVVRLEVEIVHVGKNRCMEVCPRSVCQGE